MEQGVFLDQPALKKETLPVSAEGDVAVIDAASTVVIGNHADSASLLTAVVPYPLPSLEFQISKVQEFSIRALDIVGSVLGLVVLLPLCALIALLIKIFSPGPVIYKQQRVGKDSQIFILYKFRTMVDHAEAIWGLLPASPDDERVTTIGKLLRRTRLDELPQLFNVLKGDMSLVGPRPENVYRVNMHKVLKGPRLSVRPGLTGLAQIRSFYDLKPERKIKYDYLYIQNRSLLLNIYILLQTIPVIFLKRGW
jgi:lipopolysaccharide/colanic/teichoic acid biosynthesis glycosyltransferase